MKHTYIILFFTTILFSFSLFASDYSLGFVLGTQGGLSGKYQISDRNQVQADLSGSFGAVDYLWIDERNFNVKELSWLYGAGVVSKSSIGIRGLTGAEYKFDSVPFHAFGNVSYTFANKSSLGVAVGARYEF